MVSNSKVYKGVILSNFKAFLSLGVKLKVYNTLKRLFNKGTLIALTGASIFGYSPAYGEESGFSRVIKELNRPANFYLFRAEQIEETQENGKKEKPKQEQKKLIVKGHKSHIYATDPAYPSVLLDEIGPATSPIYKVGNEGLNLNSMYKTDLGYHFRFRATSLDELQRNLQAYTKEKGSDLYTKQGRSTKIANLESLLNALKADEGRNFDIFASSIRDGILTEEEVRAIRDGRYAVWIESVNDKTGEVGSSLSLMTDVEYKEPVKVEEMPGAKVEEVPQVKESKPSEEVSAIVEKAEVGEEYSKCNFGGAVRFVNDKETKPALELGFVYYPNERFGFGIYTGFGPKFSSSTLTELSGEVDPEGIHGEGSINIERDKNYSFSVGPRVSVRPCGNWSFDISAGVAKVNETLERTDISRLVRGDEVLDQDIDVLTVEDSHFAGDYSIGGNIPIGENASISIGAGSLDGKGYGKLGVNILK